MGQLLLAGTTSAVRDAVLSPDGHYRYQLCRIWDGTEPHVVWILLNPSTADADLDDPTVRRCMAFAHTWGAGGIVIVNLFAARATNPAVLAALGDPIGPQNALHLRAAVKHPAVQKIVCGWGVHGNLHDRGESVRADLALWGLGRKVFCLGKTKDGQPKHPLYLAWHTPLEPF